MLIDDLATPCLLIERHRLENNLQRMQAKADANDVVLRPHVKTHKSVAIARRQVEQGARGITVAKVGEAEVFVDAGFDDVRLAYPVIGRDKYERLLALMGRARISFCVDTPDGIQAASAFFDAHDRTVDVVMEIDVGHGRCGIPWQDERGYVALAQHIGEQPGVRLTGILTHAGQAYAGPQDGESPEEALRRVSANERDRMLTVAACLHEAGIADTTPDGAFDISIGSTPSMRYFENRTHDGLSITEIRPGNYVFNDMIQVGLEAATLQDCALTALTTVISKRRDRSGQDRLYVDAGRKVFTSDTGSVTEGYGQILYNPARMQPHPHARLTGLSEEHGWVQVHGGSTFVVGDRPRAVPNHACVAVNTQDILYLVEGDEVIDELTVDARGRVS